MHGLTQQSSGAIELDEYVLLDSRMAELQWRWTKTLERCFWSSVCIGAVGGLLFAWVIADLGTSFSSALFMSLGISSFCAIFAGLLGYVLGQFLGWIRFLIGRRRSFSAAELARLKELRFRVIGGDLSEV